MSLPVSFLITAPSCYDSTGHPLSWCDHRLHRQNDSGVVGKPAVGAEHGESVDSSDAVPSVYQQSVLGLALEVAVRYLLLERFSNLPGPSNVYRASQFGALFGC